MKWTIKLILKTIFAMSYIRRLAYVATVKMQTWPFDEHLTPRFVTIEATAI